MFKFYFGNEETGESHQFDSDKRFVLLTGKANASACYADVVCLDANGDFLDELVPDYPAIRRYPEEDTVVIRVDDETDAQDPMFQSPGDIKCRLVIYGSGVTHLPEAFRELCTECSATGAEPADA